MAHPNQVKINREYLKRQAAQGMVRVSVLVPEWARGIIKDDAEHYREVHKVEQNELES